jgi:hypothetical protein
MNDIDSSDPTEITRDDIDQVMLQWENDANKHLRMAFCTSCHQELPYMLTDYFTGQCQQCLSDRKPWVSSSPVRNLFFLCEEK